jgi:hypothetical protein
MFEDHDLLALNKPPRLRAPADITERIMRRIGEEEQLARYRRNRRFRIATAALSFAFCLVVLRWFLEPADGPFKPMEAHSKPPASAPAPAPAPVRSPVTAPAVSLPQTTTAVAHQEPAPAPPPKLASTPDTILPETTETFPAPPPTVRPFRSNIELAHETIGPDGRPVSPPPPPPLYYRKGIAHAPIAPPGTPTIHGHITVTGPATTTTAPPTMTTPPTTTNPPADTTTTNPPADTTTTNPPTGTQP